MNVAIHKKINDSVTLVINDIPLEKVPKAVDIMDKYGLLIKQVE
jgi:hypothetical protein